MGSHIHMTPGPPKSRSGCYPCVPTTTTMPYNLIIIPKACNLCMLVHEIFEPEITLHLSEGWVQLKPGQGRKRTEKEEEVGRWQLHSVSVKADWLDDTRGMTHYTLSNPRMPRRHYNSHICFPERICIPSRPKKFLLYLVADYCLYDESHTFSQPSSGSWLNGIEQDGYNAKACSLRMFLQSWNRFDVWMNPILFRSKVSTIQNFLRWWSGKGENKENRHIFKWNMKLECGIKYWTRRKLASVNKSMEQIFVWKTQ
jgi:hypothetical protein